MSDRLIRLPEVLAMIGVSDSTLRRWERAGTFPARLRVGPNCTCHRLQDIVDFVRSRPTVRAL